jgi:long-chain fatty acid transport protein
VLPALVALLAFPRAGHAIGFELTTPGAREAGRAGASVVGADSAMGLFYNPATLLNAKAFTDTELALHNSWTDLCFTRQAVIEDASGGRSAGATSPEICGDAKTAIIPIGASVFRFNNKFALAYGVYSPPAVGRDIRFGSQVQGTPNGAVPTSAASLSPSRYMLMHESILQTFPTLGLAWSPFKQLKLGASFGWGFTRFNFSTGSFSRTNSGTVLGMETGGTSDVGSYVKGKDKFTPRVNVGIWGKPVASVPIELGLQYVWTGDVQTDDGKLRIRNLYTEYYPAALTSGFKQPALDASFQKTSVSVPQNSVLSGGVRYANKLASPAGKMGDRMSSERFDLELDYVMTFARLDSVDVTPPTGASLTVPSPSPLVMAQTLTLPNKISIAHKWQNQYGIRIGGDYNVLPNLLSLRAGYSFESNGIKPGYSQLDFTPFKRFGLSAGATVRIIDLIDLSASYAYFFIPDVSNSIDDAGLRRNVSGSPRAGDAEIANAGKITQTASSFIVEVGVHL